MTALRPGVVSSGVARRGRPDRIAGLRAPLLVALLCLALEGIADLLLRHEAGVSGDERFYERMAVHPGGPHNFPYAFRVALPWLVHVLPFPHVVSFTALALLAIAAGGGVMYALLGDFDVRPDLAVGLAVGFALAPNLVVILVRHGRSVDAALVLVMTLGSLFIVRRRKLALAITLLIGAGIHESCMFLIPFAYAVWAQRPIDPGAARDTILVGALPLVLYFVLRSSIDAVAIQDIPGYTGPFLQERWDTIRTGLSGSDLPQQLRRLAIAYGPIWLVAPFALRKVSFARRGLVLVALCLASMTFAYGWGRIIFFAAPVFYVAAGRVLADRRRLAVVAVLALFAFDIGYAVYLQAYGTQHGIDSTIGASSQVPAY